MNRVAALIRGLMQLSSSLGSAQHIVTQLLLDASQLYSSHNIPKALHALRTVLSILPSSGENYRAVRWLILELEGFHRPPALQPRPNPPTSTFRPGNTDSRAKREAANKKSEQKEFGELIVAYAATTAAWTRLGRMLLALDRRQAVVQLRDSMKVLRKPKEDSTGTYVGAESQFLMPTRLTEVRASLHSALAAPKEPTEFSFDEVGGLGSENAHFEHEMDEPPSAVASKLISPERVPSASESEETKGRGNTHCREKETQSEKNDTGDVCEELSDCKAPKHPLDSLITKQLAKMSSSLNLPKVVLLRISDQVKRKRRLYKRKLKTVVKNIKYIGRLNKVLKNQLLLAKYQQIIQQVKVVSLRKAKTSKICGFSPPKDSFKEKKMPGTRESNSAMTAKQQSQASIPISLSFPRPVDSKTEKDRLQAAKRKKKIHFFKLESMRSACRQENCTYEGLEQLIYSDMLGTASGDQLRTKHWHSPSPQESSNPETANAPVSSYKYILPKHAIPHPDRNITFFVFGDTPGQKPQTRREYERAMDAMRRDMTATALSDAQRSNDAFKQTIYRAMGESIESARWILNEYAANHRLSTRENAVVYALKNASDVSASTTEIEDFIAELDPADSAIPRTIVLEFAISRAFRLDDVEPVPYFIWQTLSYIPTLVTGEAAVYRLFLQLAFVTIGQRSILELEGFHRPPAPRPRPNPPTSALRPGNTDSRAKRETADEAPEEQKEVGELIAAYAETTAAWTRLGRMLLALNRRQAVVRLRDVMKVMREPKANSLFADSTGTYVGAGSLVLMSTRHIAVRAFRNSAFAAPEEPTQLSFDEGGGLGSESAHFEHEMDEPPSASSERGFFEAEQVANSQRFPMGPDSDESCESCSSSPLLRVIAGQIPASATSGLNPIAEGRMEGFDGLPNPQPAQVEDASTQASSRDR